MAIYAIGDIQGCYDELTELLDLIGYAPDRDRLWFVGDLVNRGPGSLQTLRLVKPMGDNAITVLGNHDFHLLRLAAGFGKEHRGDTLKVVLDAPDRTALIDWLLQRPLAHREDGWLLIHAGLVPQAPDWMQRTGLEWAYRLAHEPRRLWKRYAKYNPAFVVGFVRQWLVHRSASGRGYR